MAQIRGNLGKRQQDKESAVQRRMGQNQVLVGKDQIVIEEKIKVKGPVLVALLAPAPEPAKREWSVARAWLRRELTREDARGS